MMSRRGNLVLFGIVATIAGCYVLYPVITVLYESFGTFNDLDELVGYTLDNYARAFSAGDDRALLAIWNSVWVSAISTLLAGLIGIPMAFLFGTVRFPGRGPLAALAYVPLTLPPVVGMFAFYMLTGRVGLIPRQLGEWFHPDGVPIGELSGIAGVLLVHAYSFCVFFYAMTSAAIQRIDPSLCEAARTLGASRVRVFVKVTMPALAPAIAGAAALAFMVSMGSFSAPLYLAQGVPFLSVWIYQAAMAEGVLEPDIGLAAAESVIGVVICMAFLALTNRFGQDGSAGRGVRAFEFKRVARLQQAMLSLLGGIVVVVLLLPQLTVVAIAFSDFPKWESGLLPPSLTTANFERITSSAARMTPIWNSVKWSAIATAVTLVFGLAASWVLLRSRVRGRLVLDFVLMLPFALPGTVIAFCLLRAFNEPTPQTLGNLLVGSVWMLPFAYFVRCIPLAVRPLVAAMRTADPSHEEAARTLGATPLTAFRRIMLPHLWPAIGASGLLVYVTCLGEFVVSIMVSVPSNTPMGVQVYRELQSVGVGGPAAYSVVLIASMIVVMIGQQVVARR